VLIDRCGTTPIVLGGDWNATFSTLDSPDNIDTYSMPRPPSVFRSQLLWQICAEKKLTDPYRARHPDRRDYTYIPRTGRTNRSRIDFFITSDELLTFVSDCSIAGSLSSAAFDHKPVLLNIGPVPVPVPTTIFNSTL
jgi:exonuclease III